LTFEIYALLGDLQGHDHAMDYIPGFANDTQKLPIDSQIQKLRNQLERMRRLLEKGLLQTHQVLSCQHQLLRQMRWRRAGKRSTNTNEKGKGFLLFMPLVFASNGGREASYGDLEMPSPSCQRMLTRIADSELALIICSAGLMLRNTLTSGN
jgi:hypothetical protein